MVLLWHEVDFAEINKIHGKDGKMVLSYGDEGKPFRFQTPVGECAFGIGEYDSIQIDFSMHQSFVNWFRDLETSIGPSEPFNSNMKEDVFRLKTDGPPIIVDWSNKMAQEKVDLGRTQLVTIVDIPAVYYFKEQYGLTCRAYQIKFKKMEDEKKCLFSF
jgi:hypothetical protein